MASSRALSSAELEVGSESALDCESICIGYCVKVSASEAMVIYKLSIPNRRLRTALRNIRNRG